MSMVPETPKAKSSAIPTTPAAARISSTSQFVQSSPHYATTRRHSLYGVEDRVVIDPGSRIWKVGFSGEGRPRDVFYAGGPSGVSLWKLKRAVDPAEVAEEDRLLELNLQDSLRSVFHDSLLADPKARKVIVVEHPLLPLYIKEMIARILFENQVPSVSFASSHLLSLLSVGRITGLVVDSGHLESVALPIFAARPMYPQIQTTPLAGSRLTSHIRALLLMFATYLPPPSSLSAAISVPNANRATRIPQEVLNDAVVEEIKTRGCFVSDVLGSAREQRREDTPGPEDDPPSEMDIPPSSDASVSESDFSHAALSQPDSEFSVVSGSFSGSHADQAQGGLQAIATMYKRHSTATDLLMRVTPPPSQQTGTGRGTLIIPGWIRERAAEVLFEGGDVDESSVAELILDALLKVPRDLRKTMASSILVTGGTAMLPGFIPRLHTEILRTLSTPPSAKPPNTSKHSKRTLPPYDKYAPLRPLLPYIAILNNPKPPAIPASDRAKANAGKAPAFVPALMPWVGGSLAGALKTGGAELAREKWDEMDEQDRVGEGGRESSDMDVDGDRVHLVAGGGSTPQKARSILPDWTRLSLPMGAPPANVHPVLG